jgi:hypothetical protein
MQNDIQKEMPSSIIGQALSCLLDEVQSKPRTGFGRFLSLSKSESEYWKKYLEDNEKRIIKRIWEINY